MTQTWLTQEAADRLAAELAELEGPRRAEIVKKIEAARAEGDLKENGGYHAAREEQGKNEARIKQLKHMLEHAVIGAPPVGEAGVVGPGLELSRKGPAAYRSESWPLPLFPFERSRGTPATPSHSRR